MLVPEVFNTRDVADHRLGTHATFDLSSAPAHATDSFAPFELTSESCTAHISR